MLEVVSKGKILTSKEIWFSDKIDKVSKCDYCKYYAVGDALHKNSEKQYSLMTDLFRTEDDLYAGITKSFRQQIEHAVRAHIQITIKNSAEISSEPIILRSLFDMHGMMSASKNIPSSLTMNILNDYVASGGLIITCASYKSEPIVFHAYLCDVEGKTKARWLYSCSDFRSQVSQMANLIGCANRLLIWRDILFFKGMGIHFLDWGGVMSFDEPNGVDWFKMQFGGDPVTYYNVRLPISFKAKIHEIVHRYH